MLQLGLCATSHTYPSGSANAPEVPPQSIAAAARRMLPPAASASFRTVLTSSGEGTLYACSVSFVEGLGEQATPPGSIKGLQLVVRDIQAAREHLIRRGIEVSPIRHVENGVWQRFLRFRAICDGQA